MCLSCDNLFHSSIIYYLNAEVNAPRYATTPEAINTSPVSMSYYDLRSSASSFHLPFSPPKDSISYVALSSCNLQSS